MLDLKFVLANLELVREKTAKRSTEVDFDTIERLAARRRELLNAYSEGRHEQRRASEEMRSIDKKSEGAKALREKLKGMSGQLKAWDVERAEVEADLQERMLYIPNITHDSIPDGKGEEDNEEVRQWGTPGVFDFTPKAHWDIGEALGILDFERGTKIAGARFTVLKGAAARLERALINFMLDIHTGEHGYEEMMPPFLVNRASMTGTGQLPKFEADAFKTDNDLFLTPTAEVPVTNFYRGEILSAEDLPQYFAAYTPCFRLEAGSHGRDTRGLIRQHQFNKVEMVKFVKPETSYDELEALVKNAETILQRLELPYRVMTLSTGDVGFSAAKCYDLEVWLPGQSAYREISSCSNFEDYQARRAGIRFRPEAGAKPQFVHTINGSGLAVGRTLLAILENFQQADGSVVIPEALRPYTGFDRIK